MNGRVAVETCSHCNNLARFSQDLRIDTIVVISYRRRVDESSEYTRSGELARFDIGNQRGKAFEIRARHV